MKTLLIDVNRQKAEFMDVEFDFEKFYELMECTIVEYAYRYVGNKQFLFVLDEEGTFKEDARISAVNTAMEIEFVGSFLVFGIDEDSETGARSLTLEECDTLKEHVEYIGTRLHPEGNLCIRDVQYI